MFTVRSLASTVVQVQGTGTKAGIVNPGKTLAAPSGPAGAMEQVWRISPQSLRQGAGGDNQRSLDACPAAFGGRGCFASAQAITTTTTG